MSNCLTNTPGQCVPVTVTPNVCFRDSTGVVQRGSQRITQDCVDRSAPVLSEFLNAAGVVVAGAVYVACPPEVMIANQAATPAAADPCCPKTNEELVKITANTLATTTAVTSTSAIAVDKLEQIRLALLAPRYEADVKFCSDGVQDWLTITGRAQDSNGAVTVQYQNRLTGLLQTVSPPNLVCDVKAGIETSPLVGCLNGVGLTGIAVLSDAMPPAVLAQLWRDPATGLYGDLPVGATATACPTVSSTILTNSAEICVDGATCLYRGKSTFDSAGVETVEHQMLCNMGQGWVPLGFLPTSQIEFGNCELARITGAVTISKPVAATLIDGCANDVYVPRRDIQAVTVPAGSLDLATPARVEYLINGAWQSAAPAGWKAGACCEKQLVTYYSAFTKPVQLLKNTSFELPLIGNTLPTPGTFKTVFSNQMPNWYALQTGLHEIWHTGFNGVPAAVGNYFIELNSNGQGITGQSFVVPPEAGTLIWSFQHRGRFGPDTAAIKIGPVGSTVVVSNVTTDNAGWVTYSGTVAKAAGLTSMAVEFEAVSSFAGGIGSGNFLDDIKLSFQALSEGPSIGYLSCTDCTITDCNGNVLQQDQYSLENPTPVALKSVCVALPIPAVQYRVVSSFALLDDGFGNTAIGSESMTVTNLTTNVVEALPTFTALTANGGGFRFVGLAHGINWRTDTFYNGFQPIVRANNVSVVPQVVFTSDGAGGGSAVATLTVAAVTGAGEKINKDVSYKNGVATYYNFDGTVYSLPAQTLVTEGACVDCTKPNTKLCPSDLTALTKSKVLSSVLGCADEFYSADIGWGISYNRLGETPPNSYNFGPISLSNQIANDSGTPIYNTIQNELIEYVPNSELLTVAPTTGWVPYTTTSFFGIGGWVRWKYTNPRNGQLVTITMKCDETLYTNGIWDSTNESIQNFFVTENGVVSQRRATVQENFGTGDNRNLGIKVSERSPGTQTAVYKLTLDDGSTSYRTGPTINDPVFVTPRSAPAPWVPDQFDNIWLEGSCASNAAAVDLRPIPLPDGWTSPSSIPTGVYSSATAPVSNAATTPGSILSAGVSQPLLLANADRVYFLFQNTSNADIFLNFGGIATPLDLKVASGGNYETPAHFLYTGVVNCYGSVAGQTFVKVEA